MYIDLNGTVLVKIRKSIQRRFGVLGTATGADGEVCCGVPTLLCRSQGSSAPRL